MDPISYVEGRMRRFRPIQRTRFLHGIYKQLVVSREGRKVNGEFRRYFCDSGISGGSISEEFLLYFTGQLKKYGMDYQAKRFREQYCLEDKLEK